MKAGDLLTLCRPANGAAPCPYDGLGCIDEAHCKRDINTETLRDFGCVKYMRAQNEKVKSSIHDDLCATRRGHPCNCPSAAFYQEGKHD